MDRNTAPIWSLSTEGAAYTASKKMALETAVALSYLHVLIGQRETNDPIYQPFLNQLLGIETIRRTEMRSWLASDPNVLANVEALFDTPKDVMVDILTNALHEYGAAPWAHDLLCYLVVGHRLNLHRVVGRDVPFYGMTSSGDIFQTEFAIPFRAVENPYPTMPAPPVIPTPFWEIVRYLINASQPTMQSVAVMYVILNNVEVLTDPLRRMSGDTIITALWTDLTAGKTCDDDFYKGNAAFREMAFPQVYRDDTSSRTGLEWLDVVCRRNDAQPFSFSRLTSVVSARSSLQTHAMLESNPSFDDLSQESLPLAGLIMAEGDNTTDDTEGDATGDAQSTTTQTPAGTSSSDDGEAAATSTDTPDPDPSPSADPGATEPETDTDPDPSPTPVEPASEEQNNIGDLSFDTTGETRGDHIYRRGVLALANKIDDDMDFPVSDEVRSLLKTFTEVMLFSVTIAAVRDYMKKLGLQSYLEAVSF